MWSTGYSKKVSKNKMVHRLNKEIGLAWAQTMQKRRSLHEQMALLRDIVNCFKNFQLLKNQTNEAKPQNQNRYQNKSKNNNTRGGLRVKKRSEAKIGTNRKDHVVELKEISEDIIAESKRADMCLKCEKGSYKWFEYYTKKVIMTRRVPKKDGVPQVRDTNKKQRQKMLRFQQLV